VDRSSLPIAIGGPDAEISLSEDQALDPAAHIGEDDGDLFIQPAQAGAAVRCNGDPLTASQWLHDGDLIEIGELRIGFVDRFGEIRLEVERGRQAATDPPRLTPPPRAAKAPPPPVERVMIAPADFTPTKIGGSAKRRRVPRPVQLATWTLLALLAGIAWFTFTAKSVELRLDPPPDSLAIQGTWLQLELGGTHRIRPGRYRIVAEKEGYRRLEAILEVSRQAHQVHELRFEQLPGYLTVATRPAEGVAVAVDGQSIGITPLDPIELSPGEHRIKVSAEHYRGNEAMVTIEGSGSTASVELQLRPLWAQVSFDSTPQGATIRVDGEALGNTPATADLMEGRRSVEIRLDGYKPYRTTLDVVANEPLSPRSPTLQPVEGWLIVTTSPEGATVNIDGTFRGPSPLELELAPGGEHLVAASLRGHQATEERVRIVSGRTHEVHLELEAEYGEIEVVAAPPDAELLIDGRSHGAASQTVRLTALPHRIEVRKPGFISISRQVTPRPGLPQRLEIELQTEQEAREATRPSVGQTSQGQEMRLIGPGRFRMGASRREPGRRANETLREVELTRHFYLATEEVSNVEFLEFRPGHRAGQIGGSSLDLDDYPVVKVTWEDAARYCNWLSARESRPLAYIEQAGTLVAAKPMNTGYRLPTEAEWVWAARYEGGGPGKKYPWGDSLPVAPDSGNYGDAAARSILPSVIPNLQDGHPATAPVDSFAPNALGLFNLGGNVAEWNHDPYSIYSSVSTGIDKDPMGPDEGGYHLIRGAGWMDSTITELRLSYRDYGDEARPDVGFRIARYAD